MSAKITLEMQAGAKPAVMTLLDGHAKPSSKMQFLCYPAIKFPKYEHEVGLIEEGQTEIRAAKNHAAAMKIATRITKDVVTAAKAKLAEQKKAKKP